jgi:hypothetical protein
MSTQLPRLAAEHPAAVESARQHFIEYRTNWPKHALQRTGTKRFSLMTHWFYSMIEFGRAAQTQEGNENVL